MTRRSVCRTGIPTSPDAASNLMCISGHPITRMCKLFTGRFGEDCYLQVQCRQLIELNCVFDRHNEIWILKKEAQSVLTKEFAS